MTVSDDVVFLLDCDNTLLDNITRGLLTSGTRGRYISDLALTGLTSNPTIFDHAIEDGDFYDDAIRTHALEGRSDMARIGSKHDVPAKAKQP